MGRVSLPWAPTRVGPDAPRVLSVRPTKFERPSVPATPMPPRQKGLATPPRAWFFSSLGSPGVATSVIRRKTQLMPLSRPRFRRADPHLQRPRGRVRKGWPQRLRPGGGLGIQGPPSQVQTSACLLCSCPSSRLIPPPSVSSVLLLGLALSYELCSLGHRVQTGTRPISQQVR